MWIVDPIDATANYARGILIWANAHRPADRRYFVLGLVNAPAIGERHEAVRSGGARMNSRPIRVSAVDDIGDAQVFFGGLQDWLAAPRQDPPLNRIAHANRNRGVR